MNRQRMLAAAVAALAVVLQALGVFVGLDEELADRMLRRRGEIVKVPRSVAIVGITDTCVQALGQWPWKPDVLAQMIEKLTADGAASILWDLPLPAGGLDKLAAAFIASGSVLVPVDALDASAEDGAGRIVAPRVVEPAPALAKAAAGVGHVQLLPDRDGKVRRLAPVLRAAGHDRAALPLLALARRVMAPGEAPPLDPVEIAEKLDVTPDRGGRMRLKYYGGTAFEVQPFAEVLAGDIDRSAFEGRVVLVGGATLGSHTQFSTPCGRMDRVQILATAVANGLEGQFLDELPWWAVALVLAAVAIVGGRLVERFGELVAFALGAGAIAAYGALVWWAYVERARLLPVAGVAFALAGSLAAPLVYATGLRTARRLRARPWAAITGFTREGPLVELARETLGQAYGDISLLGAGGMSFVVKAVRRADQRPVAVKVLSPQLADQPGERQRFEREVQLLAALPHSGIVRLLSWELAGLPHYTMELVVGVSLAERLRGGARPLAEVAQVIGTLAETLAFAHQHKCVHRDVKPANVLMDDQGAVKLIDFGAACRFDSALADVPAALGGTPDYMAPEALDGAPSPRLDVFGLGLLAYELLVGRLPWARGTPPHARGPVPPLAGVPPAVVAAITVALAPDPASRPDSTMVLGAVFAPYREA